jgi:hypothetical protein
MEHRLVSFGHNNNIRRWQINENSRRDIMLEEDRNIFRAFEAVVGNVVRNIDEIDAIRAQVIANTTTEDLRQERLQRELMTNGFAPRRLDYQAVGRSLLMVDELPPGAMARYNRDTIPQEAQDDLDYRGEAIVADQPNTGGDMFREDGLDGIRGDQEVLMPVFELASNPTINLSREPVARRFYIVDRDQIRERQPTFHTVGFKPSKDNTFDYEDEESPFSIYGVK